MKKFFQIIFISIFIILSLLIAILSTTGFETNRLNNVILKKINENNKFVTVDLKKLNLNLTTEI